MNIHTILVACAAIGCSVNILEAEDHEVKSKTGQVKVLENGKMEYAPLENVDPESIQRSGDFPALVSKTFVPPKNKTFVKLDKGNFADVYDSLDGFFPLYLIDEANQVKIARIFLPSTAANFPLQVEGMLTAAGGGGGNANIEYWAVQVAKSYKTIVLQNVISEIILGQDTMLVGFAFALDNLKAQADVDITFTLEDDKGKLSGGDPYMIRKTQNDPNDPSNPDPKVSLMGDNPLLPTPHDGATKYILKAKAKGYAEAIAYIPIYKARWLENPNHQFEGYDPIPDKADPKNRPQLVVGKDKTTDGSELRMSEAVENLGILITVNAIITPDKTSGLKTETPVKGINIGSADAQAKKDNKIYAEMNVTVMDELKGPKIKFIFVKDTPTNGPDGKPEREPYSGEMEETVRDTLFDGAQQIWLNQAVYRIDKNPNFSEIWQTPQTMKKVVTPDDALKATAGRARPQAGEIYVYVFWSLGVPVSASGKPGGGFVNQGRPGEIFIDITCSGRILAHELGHTKYFGLVPPGLAAR